MNEQDLINKIEWVNKRCLLRKEPLTQSQIELLKFVFADNVANKISSNPELALHIHDVSGSLLFTCGDCGKELTEVRPGKHQCDNEKCKSNDS